MKSFLINALLMSFQESSTNENITNEYVFKFSEIISRTFSQLSSSHVDAWRVGLTGSMRARKHYRGGAEQVLTRVRMAMNRVPAESAMRQSVDDCGKCRIGDDSFRLYQPYINNISTIQAIVLIILKWKKPFNPILYCFDSI